jgi:gamma-glutamyltranspeptidase/glutathione hydrolase
MKTALAAFTAACVMVACVHTSANVPAVAARVRPTFPDSWRFRSGEPAVRTEHAMVVSNSRIASNVGSDIMRRGGNAVDAAVAVGFALTVTLPSAGNIGGGGFMVLRLKDGQSLALDYREVAPRAASRNMYLDSLGKLTDKSIVGHLAVGVPGSVAGMTEALRRYGSMSLAQVIAPAIELAEQGWVIDSSLWNDLRGDSALITSFEGRRTFFPDGRALPPGARLRQPELAWSLRQISARGADGFYTGPVADSLVAEIRRGGGIMTHEDLRAYQPVWRTPVRGTYRGHTILSMPPASSGGITMTEALNILETYEQPAPFGGTQ